MKNPLLLLSGLLLALMAPVFAGAQGILLPEDHPRDPFIRRPIPVQPFYVKNLRVNATITDSVAETVVEQTFVNNSSVDQEGTYLYPLPEGAMPTSFSMTVGERTLEPKILSKDEARQIYESIVRQRKDPALLEYVGRNLVRINVFPIPPRGERVIRLRYTEVLKPEGGVRKYAYSLSTSRFGAKPVGVASVTIKLRSTGAIKNVYSPSHDVAVRRTDDHTATASWEGINDASDRDLLLYFSASEENVGLSLLTYRTMERDGYFMLLASPRVSVPKNQVLSKQVVFVMDRTGSMAGEKIKQAKNALLFCLSRLNPQDRFNVVTFSDAPDVFAKTLVPATEENVTKAKRFMQDVEASGGTNIDEGLRAGLTLLKNEDGKQKMLVFMTDGLPTLGETNIETILQHVKSLNGARRVAEGNRPRLAGLQERNPENGANARIFSFGVGYDVNVPFLDRLGDIGRGDTDYVKPTEDVEVKVSEFYAKISSPVLSDLKLAFDNMDIYDVYPKTYPDMFKGSQLVITGRFRGATNDGILSLTGNANGDKESFRIKTAFRNADTQNSFLPRIWAARKIGYLADQIRLSNNPAGQKEVVDEIVKLSQEYGIITEYTSFLVDEREQIRMGLSVETRDFRRELSQSDMKKIQDEVVRRAGQNGVQGEGVTNQSLRAKDAQKADKLASRYQSAQGGVYYLESEKGAVASAPGNFGRAGGMGGSGGPAGPGGGGYGGFGGGLAGGGRGRSNTDLYRKVPGEMPDEAASQVNVQAVADKTFYRQKNNVWQDNGFDAKKQKLITVRAFSDAHFALLRALPKLGAYSSVGDEVIIRLGRNAVQIGKIGREKLTDAELKEIAAK